eukprot:gnl/TRDRNA2_/TRDRNA2_160733_c1_seq1.p3 gnl/TRDRNA2_/TRDRNA2_160733_c1~~gnl/TRDRNA2_/TRDRNA2_160733_c1_seq1.p3  ORF type:complete len:112 (-),score=16.12 gnl/TRDRNA2_/TRDRNA2_160733_c1_seq1:23-358(-)
MGFCVSHLRRLSFGLITSSLALIYPLLETWRGCACAVAGSLCMMQLGRYSAWMFDLQPWEEKTPTLFRSGILCLQLDGFLGALFSAAFGLGKLCCSCCGGQSSKQKGDKQD